MPRKRRLTPFEYRSSLGMLRCAREMLEMLAERHADQPRLLAAISTLSDAERDLEAAKQTAEVAKAGTEGASQGEGSEGGR